eukprot:6205981-Pleurochrysis_carterae.AAC.2
MPSREQRRPTQDHLHRVPSLLQISTASYAAKGTMNDVCLRRHQSLPRHFRNTRLHLIDQRAPISQANGASWTRSCLAAAVWRSLVEPPIPRLSSPTKVAAGASASIAACAAVLPTAVAPFWIGIVSPVMLHSSFGFACDISLQQLELSRQSYELSVPIATDEKQCQYQAVSGNNSTTQDADPQQRISEFAHRGAGRLMCQMLGAQRPCRSCASSRLCSTRQRNDDEGRQARRLSRGDDSVTPSALPLPRLLACTLFYSRNFANNNSLEDSLSRIVHTPAAEPSNVGATSRAAPRRREWDDRSAKRATGRGRRQTAGSAEVGARRVRRHLSTLTTAGLDYAHA